ncbi:enamine deaminase RidA (YjgF/YER057c/UK114 family) [Aminobacter lissarensis]|uniref:Enamine deaminase RidA (YjgF/YER057c/UK114 family) n=1 Tax=Aminobacter carboxidus TaxID=376165 RepID=A0A8E1WH75_9HYPH|nr:RidA family protein [Aminobacter lissarensis]MBB6468855.1 enamine deaminase RidA (YjgF/YER057c/UK114 family) [Aminobacter lissarensis]
MSLTLEPGDVAGVISRFGIGKRASMAVVHNGTGYFAVTPQAPYDAELSTAEQAVQLLAKAEARLAEIGSGKEKLLFVAIILADMADLASVNASWDEWVAGMAPPARACFEAPLANPALKIEMIMVCAAREVHRRDGVGQGTVNAS